MSYQWYLREYNKTQLNYMGMSTSDSLNDYVILDWLLDYFLVAAISQDAPTTDPGQAKITADPCRVAPPCSSALGIQVNWSLADPKKGADKLGNCQTTWNR